MSLVSTNKKELQERLSKFEKLSKKKKAVLKINVSKITFSLNNANAIMTLERDATKQIEEVNYLGQIISLKQSLDKEIQIVY